MRCTVVVGGQYGSEGKGKITAREACRVAAPFVVRCGGPNSGHTVVLGGRSIVLRQVPAGILNPNSTLLLAPGCVIDADVLLAELQDLSISKERLVIDPRAVIVAPEDRAMELEWSTAIGSTGSGNGAALIRRMQRSGSVRLADTSEQLRAVARIESVADLTNRHLDHGGDVLVEGTQGFGLSLLHGIYPYVTSRDTTAAAFAAEVGISPRVVDRVIMVLRTFPIRVGGNSGPLSGEMSWSDVRSIGGAPSIYEEFTSVTNKLRRVGAFDWELAKRAALINRPTDIALMGVDRLEYANTGITEPSQLGPKALGFIERLEHVVGCTVTWAGTGFTDEMVRLGGAEQ